MELLTHLNVPDDDNKVDRRDEEQDYKWRGLSDGSHMIERRIMKLIFVNISSILSRNRANLVLKDLPVAVHIKSKDGVYHWQGGAKFNEQIVYLIRVFDWLPVLLR